VPLDGTCLIVPDDQKHSDGLFHTGKLQRKDPGTKFLEISIRLSLKSDTLCDLFPEFSAGEVKIGHDAVLLILQKK